MIAALHYFMRPYRALFCVLAAVMLVGSVLEGITILAFFPVFLAIAQPDGARPLPLILHAMIDASRQLPWADPVISGCILVGATLCCRAAVLFARDALIAKAGGRILYDLKQRLLAEYARLPYQFFTAEKHGTLLYQAVIAPGQIALVLQRIPQCVAETLRITAILAVLLVTFPVATTVFAVCGLAYFFGARRLTTTLAYDTGVGRSAAHAEQMEIAQQLLSGIRQLRTYGVEGHWLAQFERVNRLYRTLYTRYLTWLAAPRNVMELVAVLLLLGAIVVARATDATAFAVWVPTLGLFAVATTQLMPSLTAVGRMMMEIREATPDVERLHRVLTAPRPTPPAGRPMPSFSTGIEFDRVSFRYKGRAPVFKDLSFALPRGRVTVLTGPSGSGKTTVINLLLRLVEPTAGTIRVDGVPLTAYDAASWLRHLGFVSQDPFIFNGTVADNIRFGREGFSDEAVASAARLAHAEQFVAELPQGYQTIVGDRGTRLSGGQQQRLAIARAVLADPEILVLDEPTSALDDAAAQRVQEALFNASRGRTVLVVTHDRGVIAGAHQVVTLVPQLAGAPSTHVAVS